MAMRYRQTAQPTRIGYVIGEKVVLFSGNDKQDKVTQRVRRDLNSILEYYTLSDVAKKEILDEATQLSGIETMNLNLLAAAFAYERKYPNPTGEDFTDEFLTEYLDKLMQYYINPKKKVKESKRGRKPHPDKKKEVRLPTSREIRDVRYRFKQGLVRYLLKISDERVKNETPIEIPTEIPTESNL